MATKEKFLEYERVRKSGLFNMLDVRNITANSSLEREDIFDIIEHYEEYSKLYLKGKTACEETS